MALNLLFATVIGGIPVNFGTSLKESDPNATEEEKFKASFVAEIPSWLIPSTTGKGSKKKITGHFPAELSKRSINSVMEYVDPEMGEKFLIKKIDTALEGLRLELSKAGINKIRGAEFTQGQDDLGNQIFGVDNVEQFVVCLNSIFTALAPKVSAADPNLEAKKIYAKSSKYVDLGKTSKDDVLASWKKEELDRLARIETAFKAVSQEDLDRFVSEKFLANGLDEEGNLRLKAASAAAAS